LSKKSKRAQRRKARQARKYLERNEVKSMSDESIANPQQNEPKAKKEECLNPGIPQSNPPASTSQKQEKESSKK